jgi:hypothetical protein
LAVLIVAGLVGSAASAWAVEPRPLDDGGMIFPEIHSSADPEEYAYTVSLGGDQELPQIDERHVGVFYSYGTPSFTIEAESAHDAEGAAVPTTLMITKEDVITLTVHHREGNPAAAGAPFTYPITGGTGWAGGFRTEVVTMVNPNVKPPPAETAVAPERVLVTRALGEDKLYYRPHTFLLSGDGTFGIDKVHWKSYGGPVATATGRAFADNCLPNCAEGHIFKPQAKLVLSKIVQCQGHPVYSRLRYQLIGKLPKGLRRRGGDSMLPLGEDGKPDC